MSQGFEIEPIGIIRSCYTDKFGIPRQPGLVKSATATLELNAPYNQEDVFRGLKEFSHIWIVFFFHQSIRDAWKATVRPPRLGGNERVGVFASRSNFRPNPIGLSVVELVAVTGSALTLCGGDFLDGTPVLDIKPYLPYTDSIANAHGAFAHMAPEPTNQIYFSAEAERAVKNFETSDRPALRKLIEDMLSYNPKPAYRSDDPDRIFGTSIFDLNVKWKQAENAVIVVRIGKV